jgi:hypothetical protein
VISRCSGSGSDRRIWAEGESGDMAGEIHHARRARDAKNNLGWQR